MRRGRLQDAASSSPDSTVANYGRVAASYLGIEVDDALEIAEQTEVSGACGAIARFRPEAVRALDTS